MANHHRQNGIGPTTIANNGGGSVVIRRWFAVRGFWVLVFRVLVCG
jgi:hypothetical protein